MSALPLLSLLCERARDGQRCQHGTIFRLLSLSLCIIIHAAALNAITRASKEQDNAKTPLPTPPPLSLLRSAIPIADLFAIMGEGKGQLTIVPRHHLLLSPHCPHAPSSMLLPLMALHEKARNGWQCQGTIIRAAATIVVHSCSCSCCLCHCRRGQGMGDDAAKAPFSAWQPSLLCTVIHVVTTNVFARGSKEWAMMSRPVIHAAATIVVAHYRLRHCHDCHHAREQETTYNAAKAPSSMPLPPFVIV
jgi:hypothetical protein